MIRIHSQNTSTSLVEIAHNVTGVFVRNSDLHAYDRLKEYRRCIHKAFLERQDRCHLECHLGRVYRMIRSIVKCSLNAYYRISCQRSLLNAFLKSLLNCREVVLRNSAAYDYLLKYIRCLQVAGWLEAHLDMSILSVSTGLFLMFALYVGVLADGLTESYLRFGKFHVYFVAFFELAYYDIKVLVAHTIE